MHTSSVDELSSKDILKRMAWWKDFKKGMHRDLTYKCTPLTTSPAYVIGRMHLEELPCVDQYSFLPTRESSV